MNIPQISVIMCVYNPEKIWLEQAVDSIVGQTFTDWEMFIYDDGSKKEYSYIIKGIAAEDDRITYIRNEQHNNLAYGLNYCIRIARGKYIARMDADDISLCNRFEVQFRFLEDNKKYQWVGSNIELIDNEDVKWGGREYKEIPTIKDFLEYSPYVHPSVMFRKDALIKSGMYKEDGAQYRGEDYELFMRLYSEGYRGYNMQNCLLSYRESLQSYKKRKLRCQVHEVMIRLKGFRKMGMLKLSTLRYVIKPLVVWVIPNRIIIKRKYNRGGSIT